MKKADKNRNRRTPLSCRRLCVGKSQSYALFASSKDVVWIDVQNAFHLSIFLTCFLADAL